MKYADLTPDVWGDVYAKQHDTKVDHLTLITELVANALDAGATNIKLSRGWAGGGSFTIEDDGDGCDNLETMMKLGASGNANRNKIGRYGQGFTNSVVRVGKVAKIDTLTADGKHSSAVLDFEKIKERNSWKGSVAIKEKSNRTSKGTTVHCEGSFVGCLSLQNWGDHTRQIIQRHFTTAIERGVEIRVSEKLVRSLPQPEVTDEVSLSGSLDGKNFVLTAGILKDPRWHRSGWNVHWGDMLIMGNYVKYGFGDFTPVGFYGTIKLSDGSKRWHLSTKKDDVTELPVLLNHENVQELIRPLLEKLKAERKQAKLMMPGAFMESLNNFMNESMPAGEGDGVKVPTGQRGGTRKATTSAASNGPNESTKLYVVKPDAPEKKMPTVTTIYIEPIKDKTRGVGYCELSMLSADAAKLTVFLYDDPNNLVSIWHRGLQLDYALAEVSRWIVANPEERLLAKAMWKRLRLDEKLSADRASIVHMVLMETAFQKGNNTLYEMKESA